MEAISLTCPHCDTELLIPDSAWYYTCTECNHRLDLKSQFAYLRGLDAFSEGQHIIDRLSLQQRRRWRGDPKVDEAMGLFMEAYSSIQVAFQADLSMAQRSLAVEMMASMAEEFLKRNMISPFESSYWGTIMVEQTAQDEYDQIKEKLAQSESGLLAFIMRIRWRSRQKKLISSLADINKKLHTLEKQMAFVDFPRARNIHWKP